MTTHDRQVEGAAAGGPETHGTPSRRATRTALLGAMFLMATSAIGPGFITQTGQFTVQLGAAFAFAVLVSILIDIALQLNVWRVIGISGRRAQELANEVLPGLGWVLSALIAVGGLAFNVGNVGGSGAGLNILLGVSPQVGAAISSLLAVAIFLSAWAGAAMDRVVVALGVLMIALTAYVMVVSEPPVGDALKNTVAPNTIDASVITTLVGGTVGGYIIYAGAHRLVDSGNTGPEAVRDISRSSLLGILVTGLLRGMLFLAILGVVAAGHDLTGSTSIAGEAFSVAAGDIGQRLFGLVFWAAAISSVVGCSYTTVSFLTSSKGTSTKVRNGLTIAFIVVCSALFLVLGAAPATLLVLAGTLNGVLIPLGIGVMLWVAWFRRDLLHGYRYPMWLLVIGSVAWLATVWLAVETVRSKWPELVGLLG
ncbi:NRAMP family divalent metal transporter [Kytococcus sp. Marseille-QA3725]